MNIFNIHNIYFFLIIHFYIHYIFLNIYNVYIHIVVNLFFQFIYFFIFIFFFGEWYFFKKEKIVINFLPKIKKCINFKKNYFFFEIFNIVKNKFFLPIWKNFPKNEFRKKIKQINFFSKIWWNDMFFP